jgi:hypothetical protein
MSTEEFAQVDFNRQDVRSSLARAYEAILAWQVTEPAEPPVTQVHQVSAVQEWEATVKPKRKKQGQTDAIYHQEQMF